MRCLKVIFLVAASLFFSACSMTGYLGDRARDFSQILNADLGISSGFHAQAGVSHLVQLGIGSHHGTRFGLRDGIWGSWEEERSELGIGPYYLHELDWGKGDESKVGLEYAGPGKEGFTPYPFEWGGVQTDRQIGDLSAGITLGILGLQIQFRTLELADFLAGLFTFDPSSDDLSEKSDHDLIRDLNSPNDLVRAAAARNLAHLYGRTQGFRVYSSKGRLSSAQIKAYRAWKEELDLKAP